MVAWAVRSSAEAAWPMAAASRGGNSFVEAKLALGLLSCWVRRDARSRSWLVDARDRGCEALLRLFSARKSEQAALFLSAGLLRCSGAKLLTLTAARPRLRGLPFVLKATHDSHERRCANLTFAARGVRAIQLALRAALP